MISSPKNFKQLKTAYYQNTKREYRSPVHPHSCLKKYQDVNTEQHSSLLKHNKQNHISPQQRYYLSPKNKSSLALQEQCFKNSENKKRH